MKKEDFLKKALNTHGTKCVRRVSKWEQAVYDFITSLGINAEHSNRELLDGREIDIYIPDCKIGIECDGLRWHNESHVPKNYHLDKTNICNENGIRLVHIFEDEWVSNKEIWESMLKNALGMYDCLINADDCDIREVTPKERRKFLKHNHIKGNVQSSYDAGLFYHGEMVSIISFMKRNGDNETYELTRFCNKVGVNVIDGAKKLFEHFKNKNEEIQIIAYSDKRYDNGDVLKTLGFEHIKDLRPDYTYVNNHERENKFKYRKSKLVKEGYDKDKTEHEIMLERGIFRIYDCGTKVWKWKK